MFIEHGVFINIKDYNGKSPLLRAIEIMGTQLEMAEYSDEALRVFNRSSPLPLNDISLSERVEIIILLIERGADVNISIPYHEHGQTWQHFKLFIQILILVGHVPRSLNNTNYSLLRYAAAKGSYKIIKTVLRKKDEIYKKIKKIEENKYKLEAEELAQLKKEAIQIAACFEDAGDALIEVGLRIPKLFSSPNINKRSQLKCFKFLLFEPTVPKNMNIESWNLASKLPERFKNGEYNKLIQAIKESHLTDFKFYLKSIKDLEIWDPEKWENPLHLAFQARLDELNNKMPAQQPNQKKLNDNVIIIGLILSYNSNLLWEENIDKITPMDMAIEAPQDLLKSIVMHAGKQEISAEHTGLSPLMPIILQRLIFEYAGISWIGDKRK